MRDIDFLKTLSSLGMKTKDGIISYGEHEYGVVQDGFLKRTREGNIPLGDVANVSFIEGNDEIHMTMEDGTPVISRPTRLHVVKDSPIDVSAAPDGTIVIRAYPETFKGTVDSFPMVFPEWRDYLYYDELREKIQVDTTMFDKPSTGFIDWNDTVSAYYHYSMEDRMSRMGFTGKRPPSKENMDETILMLAGQNSKNTFREWIEGLVWDGKPRVDTWFSDVFGGTAPALTAEEERIYLAEVARAWFLGAIERMYHPFQHDIIPVFISGQGAGKTRALKYTAANDQWYCSTSVDVTGPKGTAEFLDATRGKIIVELGEATQIRTKDVDKLKEFITRPTDQLRKAYARYDQEYPRHYIMAATSNITSLFTDVTGNRRFFPVQCDPRKQIIIFSSDDRSEGREYVEQMWAEVYYLYKQGVKASLSPQVIKLAARMQAFNSKENTSITVFDDWLDDPTHNYTEIGCKFTKNDILEAIFEVTPLDYKYKEYETMFNVWANGTKSWRQCKPFRKKNDPLKKTYRGWERVTLPGDEQDVLTFNIVTSKSDPRLREVTAQARLRAICKRYTIPEFGQLPKELPQETVDLLMEFGYVVDMGVPSNPDYRVVVLP